MYISDRVDGWLLYGETNGLFRKMRLGALYARILEVQRKKGDFTRIIGITHSGVQTTTIVPKELKIRKVSR